MSDRLHQYTIRSVGTLSPCGIRVWLWLHAMSLYDRHNRFLRRAFRILPIRIVRVYGPNRSIQPSVHALARPTLGMSQNRAKTETVGPPRRKYSRNHQCPSSTRLNTSYGSGYCWKPNIRWSSRRWVDWCGPCVIVGLPSTSEQPWASICQTITVPRTSSFFYHVSHHGERVVVVAKYA